MQCQHQCGMAGASLPSLSLQARKKPSGGCDAGRYWAGAAGGVTFALFPSASVPNVPNVPAAPDQMGVFAGACRISCNWRRKVPNRQAWISVVHRMQVTSYNANCRAGSSRNTHHGSHNKKAGGCSSTCAPIPVFMSGNRHHDL